jgi:phosphoglycolate phosphatase-like HAD superfamily hydrolase
MDVQEVPENSLKILQPFPTGGFRHVLFDFDGTISLLREGWQGIMAPLMCELIAGDTPITDDIRKAVDDFIAESTGIQTILQMQQLVEMIRAFGLVPEAEIQDARAYKTIYNDRLMVPVRERLARLESGDLPIDRAVVRGSREFVAAVAEQADNLYIFSGTDREDVVNEARHLGVHDFFTEIWGALGSIEEYSKEKVLRQLMEEKGLNGAEVLIIGDGPVEIRHAARFGCVGLGVASNEEAGAGWDPVKEERLSHAGAHALVPDFEDHDDLASYLFSA